MKSTSTVLLQLAIPLLVGGLAAAYLKNALTRILLDLCGTAERADFWWRTSAILVLGLPLLLVLFFLGNPGGADPALALRDAFRLSLIGVLVAVGLLSRRIWKAIPTPESRASEPAPPTQTRTAGREEQTSCAS